MLGFEFDALLIILVNIYLSKRLRNEPYYEQHDYVAVMFATIIYARSGSIELRLLNEIICDFDEVVGIDSPLLILDLPKLNSFALGYLQLNYYKGPIKVEKIKVANWSYMAASGFDIPVKEMSELNEIFAPRQSNILPKGRRDYPSLSFSGDLTRGTRSSCHSGGSQASGVDMDTKMNNMSPDWQRKQILKTMADFALDLLVTMKTFNRRNQLERGTDEPPIMLRIGKNFTTLSQF